MGSEGREFDVIVLGGGPVGENAAEYAVRGTDGSAALVEAERFGGECSYWACMPSKALLRPVDVVDAADHLQGVAGPVALDREQLLARRDAWTSHYDDAGQVDWARSAGLTPVRGRGRITGQREVTVTGPGGARTVLRARQAVVIATGSVPVVPEELAPVRPWSTRDATGVRTVPARLGIVGGGAAAVEAARWMRALGSEITLIVRGPRLLADAEPFIGEAVARGLEQEGVRVLLRTRVLSASRSETAPDDAPDATPETAPLGAPHGGPVRLRLARVEQDQEAPGETSPRTGAELVVDEVLAATGRRPALEDLGLESIGVSPEQVTAHAHGGPGSPLPDWLYAVGDASGEAPLTHWGKYWARLVGASVRTAARGEDPWAVFDPHRDGAAAAPVPQVVFSRPQAAWTGLSTAQARERGIAVHVRRVPYTAAAGAALLRDDAEGTVQLLSRAEDDVLLGAAFLGPEVQELVHAATVAITGGLTLRALAHAVPCYPTASEVWLRALEAEPARG